MRAANRELELSKITTRVSDPPLELFITEDAFRPNPTTVRFSRTVRISERNVVFDIGTGIGPLAIMAAMAGASQVFAVDPVPVHCELARMNVAEYELENRVQVFEGDYFDPLDEISEQGVRADVIIGDVSGIAEPVARALGWYSSSVPTAGADGTEVISELLRRTPAHLAPGGTIYFPIAIDFSDNEKILDVARHCFASVENAMDRPTTQFPLTEDQMRAIDDAYGGNWPSFIKIQDAKRRPHWRGQIWKATSPV